MFLRECFLQLLLVSKLVKQTESTNFGKSIYFGEKRDFFFHSAFPELTMACFFGKIQQRTRKQRYVLVELQLEFFLKANAIA